MNRFSDLLAAPSWVVFQLLEQCNLRCDMCYEWGETGAYRHRDAPATLDLSLVLRTVEECLPARPRFEFFGGEPLLYPGLVEVMRRIREGGCELAFPTNGTLLEQHAESLVDHGPTRLWISLDGPAAVNDRQRGRGVFARVLRGMDELHAVKLARRSPYPGLGLTYVVTPANAECVESFFLREIDLSLLNAVSIELQSYATPGQCAAYAGLLEREFAVDRTPCAAAYARDPAGFAAIDPDRLARQMARVSRACAERGIQFHSRPRTLTAENLRHYLSANWRAMADYKSRCGVPWLAAEISARGEVSPCHSFYDHAVGNLHEQPLLEIWRGERLKRLRQHLRESLFPICTACCRYYESADGMPASAARDG